MLSYKELYHELKNKDDMEIFRKKIIEYAIEHKSISKAASKHKVNRKTVSKWLKRHLNEESLKDKSKKPKSCPHRISKEIEGKIIKQVEMLMAHGKKIVAKYIQRELQLVCSTKAIINALKRNNLYKKKSKSKKKKQRSFYEYKQKNYDSFEKIQIDVKYLTDIKEFKEERINYQLGNYIYSARCIKTGFYYVQQANQKTIENAVNFIHCLMHHLIKNGVDVKDLKIQTDNGSEFGMHLKELQTKEQQQQNIFLQAIQSYQAIHQSIPSGAKTWQSDVESAHRLIEDEFFASNLFDSKKDHIEKSTAYLNWFNLSRKNKHKENRSPWDIIKLSSSKIKQSICFFQYQLLDDLVFQ